MLTRQRALSHDEWSIALAAYEHYVQNCASHGDKEHIEFDTNIQTISAPPHGYQNKKTFSLSPGSTHTP